MYIFLKPLFTKIEKNNCFSIYTRRDLNKMRAESIKKYYLIDRSGQLDTRQFKNRSLQNFQTRQFTSLSLRKQQRKDLNGTAKSLNCFLTWEEKKSFVVFCWLTKFIAEKVCADKNGDSVPRGKTSSSCSILSRVYLKRRISANICFQICFS